MNEDNKIVAGQILKAASVAANTVSDEDMKAINRFTLKELTADEVFTFKVKMADNSLDDRNFAPFTLKALKQLEKLYVGRTVGKDHRIAADNQCARIYATALTESTKTNGVNGEKVYDLTAKCYMVRTEANKSLIAEIEAGIKREVSTSCSCSKVICSICGTDNTKDYCRHWGGSTYDTKDGKKTCYMLLDEIKDAYELSFVAVPAQPQAVMMRPAKGRRRNICEIAIPPQIENPVVMIAADAANMMRLHPIDNSTGICSIVNIIPGSHNQIGIALFIPDGVQAFYVAVDI